MIQSLFQKTVLTISIISLTANIYASDESKSADATSASKIETALASAGIFAGVAATIISNFVIQMPQYNNIDRTQQYVLVLVPAAFLTLGAVTYLFKSARNWKAKLSSLTGSTILAGSGLLFGLVCGAPPATVLPGFYLIMPLINTGSAMLGYALQPKQQITE